ncbi:VapE domain-containing protein, partial [Streptococcus agalactiae]|uniref:VapE domain-containing protein n=1 Tax=Streptococcus agalactiae TaxID=1311 RepID=UPI00363BF141
IISSNFNPGAKFDEMIVLVGGQGIGKSTFARYLSITDDWFCTIENIQGKDAVMNLMGKTVVEIEEFVALRNAKSANEAKSFLSKLSDRIRIPSSPLILLMYQCLLSVHLFHSSKVQVSKNFFYFIIVSL